jgi:hypothetical protein
MINKRAFGSFLTKLVIAVAVAFVVLFILYQAFGRVKLPFT